MDGYSVNEAATVLGIPEGRVWELLARGVLAGSSEVGDDMRVFLRGTTAPEPVAPATNGGHGKNGGTNGGTNGGELSAFRELLTEFRSLTERYGQALLALGEARGEVASLRGRVELLEARMDRRPGVAPLTPWPEAPAPDLVPEAAHWGHEAPATDVIPPHAEPDGARLPAHVAVQDLVQDQIQDVAPTEDVTLPEAAAPIEAVAPTEEMAPTEDVTLPEAQAPVEAAPPEAPTVSETFDSSDLAPADIESVEEGTPDAAASDVVPAQPPKGRKRSRKRRGRGETRDAVSGFADALARADDPNTERVTEEVGLPGSRETADALAAYRQEVEPGPAAEPPPVETAPPTEAAPPVEAASPGPAAVLPAGYSTATPEPDWIAEEDLEPSAVATAVMAPPSVSEERPPEPLSMSVTADEWVDAERLSVEPPAPDDAPLLTADVDPFFAEPPIVPREPAFWEPEGRSRAPFAPPEIESWDPAEIEALRAELARFAPAPPPVALSPAPAPPPVALSPAPAPPPVAPVEPEAPAVQDASASTPAPTPSPAEAAGVPSAAAPPLESSAKPPIAPPTAPRTTVPVMAPPPGVPAAEVKAAQPPASTPAKGAAEPPSTPAPTGIPVPPSVPPPVRQTAARQRGPTARAFRRLRRLIS